MSATTAAELGSLHRRAIVRGTLRIVQACVAALLSSTSAQCAVAATLVARVVTAYRTAWRSLTSVVFAMGQALALERATVQETQQIAEVFAEEEQL